MSYEKFGSTIYFFKDFNHNIDDKLVKKMSNIYFIEFVDNENLYTTVKSIYPLHNYNVFNRNIDLLPSHIKSIIFGYYFNQPVKKYLEKLKELIFGESFNQ
jgi:hypothetical protein